MYAETAEGMLDFIKHSPTAFHAVENMKHILRENQFRELSEKDRWQIEAGGKYFVSRNGSSIIAFAVGEDIEDYYFKIAASHSDSPAFKVKENAEIQVKGNYTLLNTEGYGGMVCASWLDRPLSIAGRVVVKRENFYDSRLVCVDRDLVLIPGLAIHMNREVNEGYRYNKQVDMLPLLGNGMHEKGALKRLIAEELHIDEKMIYGMDLYLYNRTEPSVWGAGQEYFSAPRLDDLECAYASLQGFLKGQDRSAVNVFTCFDNEEVGSGTKQGAGSTFLSDTLCRVNRCLGRDVEDFCRAAAAGFMVSCDNAHAVHPNHPEKTDINNCVYMNEGVVVKSHAGQKYTSDAVSIAMWKGICEKAGVPLQYFANRSDMAGGSTLGNIAMGQVSMDCVDVGLPQLAMHSAYETAGVKDYGYMLRAIESFYNTKIENRVNFYI